MHTCCSPVESKEDVDSEGAAGGEALLAVSLLDLRASVGVGTEGGLGKEGASGAKAFTALKAAASTYMVAFNEPCIVCNIAAPAAA